MEGSEVNTAREQQIERAREAANLAGMRAATFLAAMLSYGNIPSYHRKHAEEIVTAHEDAQRHFDAAINYIRVGSRVRYTQSFLAAAPSHKQGVGTVAKFEGGGQVAVVGWDDHRGRSAYVHVSNLEAA